MNDTKDQTPKKPGSVKHDARGNAVWQWAAESGRHAIESTSRMLKRLEVPGLALEDDKPKDGADPKGATVPGPAAPQAGNAPQAPKRALPPDTVKGYDPYGGRLDAPGAARKPPTTPAASPGDRPSLLSRLFRRR
jgi:hypothetical protein